MSLITAASGRLKCWQTCRRPSYTRTLIPVPAAVCLCCTCPDMRVGVVSVQHRVTCQCGPGKAPRRYPHPCRDIPPTAQVNAAFVSIIHFPFLCRCCDYGFRSGASRMYSEADDGKIPVNAFQLVSSAHASVRIAFV